MPQSLDRQSFGVMLREFRLAVQLSQEALAERASMSADGIGALERGINKAPQRETLALIVNALQLSPEQRAAIEAAARRAPRPRRSKKQVSRKHNLPRLVSPLFGREQDLADISALMAEAQFLTLTGAGGVGKTRLAVQLAYDSLNDHDDGVLFVDLGAVHDGGVTPAIAGVLGVRESADRLLIDVIVESLGRKNVLLVLDNCEHVVPSVSAAVEAIATACADVRILATSRQPLGVAGERTYRLASLSVQASISLFAETAMRADASFALDGDLPVVERICRRLDGIALAIELAGARVRMFSLAQIESLLSERFAVLTGGGPLARHQTMRALVDWSYDLLSTEERLLFVRLGVFPADFSFEAAVAICAGDGIASSRLLHILGSLVDKSLLTSERHGKVRRFRLLETMRAYALERLEDGLQSLSARHSKYYLKLVESVNARNPNRTDLFEPDYDNLQRALEWSIDERGDVALGVRLMSEMRETLLSRGMGAESARRAERALDGSTSLSKQLQALAWETIASMRGDLLLPARAFEASSHVLELFEELADHAGMARALRGRGIAYLRLGKFAEAEVDLQRSLELCRECEDRRGVMRSLGSIAVAHEMAGRLEEGRQAQLEVLEMARADGDDRIVGISTMNLAEAEFAIGEAKSAVDRLQELLSSKITRKNARLRANAEANRAAYLISLHRNDEAMEMARAAVHDAREAGDIGVMACAIQHLAAVLAGSDAKVAAKLLGYVEAVFAHAYRREHTERFTYGLLMEALHAGFDDNEIEALGREGALMTEPQAIRLATRFNPHNPHRGLSDT